MYVVATIKYIPFKLRCFVLLFAYSSWNANKILILLKKNCIRSLFITEKNFFVNTPAMQFFLNNIIHVAILQFTQRKIPQ